MFFIQKKKFEIEKKVKQKDFQVNKKRDQATKFFQKIY